MKKSSFKGIFSVCIKINFFVLVSILLIRLEFYQQIYFPKEQNLLKRQKIEYQENVYSDYQNYPNNNYIENNKAIIDYSNANYGYVRVKFIEDTNKKLKVTIESSNNRYTYCLPKFEWVILPFTEGNDTYKISIYENVVDSKYSLVLTKNVDVNLSNEFYPFLNSNLYVNFNIAPKTAQKANILTKRATSNTQKIEIIYNFIIENISYDYEKANEVEQGYIPVLDEILEERKGICFDYSALACAMLRSQNIPCKLIVGYVEDSYHAWISVYVEEDNQAICGMNHYDEEHWLHMDPTYASSNSLYVEEYINEETNYFAMYMY